MFNLRGNPAKSCRSPFREDRSPSFSISEDGLRWIDFATEVDAFEFAGLVKADRSPVKDLNDFLLADPVLSGCASEVLYGAFDFALERLG
jgi:hypothetical protein